MKNFLEMAANLLALINNADDPNEVCQQIRDMFFSEEETYQLCCFSPALALVLGDKCERYMALRNEIEACRKPH